MIAGTQPLSGPRSERLPLRTLAVLGLIFFAAGAVVAPARLGPSLLLSGYLLVSVAIGALYFLAIHSAAGAGWATVLKRAPEALTGLLPAGLLLILAAFALGAGTLYPWLHAEQAAELPAFKAAWLSPLFFFTRAIVYGAVLLLFARALRRRSLAQDRDGDRAHSLASRKISAAFLVIGSFVVWLISLDWIMALEPHWYSTMYGVYNFAGHFLAGLAAIILLVVWLQRQGRLPELSEDHLHDLGKLLFAMSTFWMYIWFSQAMLIWYSNLAEEAIYYNVRLGGAWRPLFIANVLLSWVIPFFVLLSRRAKRSPAILVRVAIVVLVGRCLDLYLMIYPALPGTKAAHGLVEIGCALILPALAALIIARSLRQAPLLPTGDPYLEESLHFHQ